MGRPAIDRPGEAREDWAITVDLARRLGLDWTYTHPREVFAEMKLVDELARQHHLGAAGGARTWSPTRSSGPDVPGQRDRVRRRLPAPEGRAKFTPRLSCPSRVPDAEYPMVLTTGGSSNTGTPAR